MQSLDSNYVFKLTISLSSTLIVFVQNKVAKDTSHCLILWIIHKDNTEFCLSLFIGFIIFPVVQTELS